MSRQHRLFPLSTALLLSLLMNDASSRSAIEGKVSDIVLQADGKLIVAGLFHPPGADSKASGLLRIDRNGKVDPTFKASIDRKVSAVAVRSDGSIVVAGAFRTIEDEPRSGIAVLSGDGSLNASLVPDIAADDRRDVLKILTLTDGSMLAAGSWARDPGPKGLARIDGNGSLVRNFAPRFGSGSPILSSVVAQTDGRIIIAGDFAAVEGQPRNGLARLYVDGSLDLSFVPGTEDGETVLAIALQPDGKLLVGTVSGLLRIMPDGEIDHTFSAALYGTVTAIALQPDRKVVVGGFGLTTTQHKERDLVRLKPDGQLDLAFDAEGVQAVERVLVLPDGKIVAAGDGLWRLQVDGALDRSFAANPELP